MNNLVSALTLNDYIAMLASHPVGADDLQSKSQLQAVRKALQNIEALSEGKRSSSFSELEALELRSSLGGSRAFRSGELL